MVMKITADGEASHGIGAGVSTPGPIQEEQAPPLPPAGTPEAPSQIPSTIELSSTTTPALPEKYSGKAEGFPLARFFGLSNQKSASLKGADNAEPLARDIAGDAQVKRLVADAKAAGARIARDGEIALSGLPNSLFLAGMARLFDDFDKKIG